MLHISTSIQLVILWPYTSQSAQASYWAPHQRLNEEHRQTQEPSLELSLGLPEYTASLQIPSIQTSSHADPYHALMDDQHHCSNMHPEYVMGAAAHKANDTPIFTEASDHTPHQDTALTLEEGSSSDRNVMSNYWRDNVSWENKDVLISKYKDLCKGPRGWCRGKLTKYCNEHIERGLMSSDLEAVWQATLVLGISSNAPGSAKILAKDIKTRLYSYIMQNHTVALNTARQIVSDGLKVLPPERRAHVQMNEGENDDDLESLYREFYPLHLEVQKEKKSKEGLVILRGVYHCSTS